MPLKLIPPGKRKGNKFYLVRGTVCGKEYEASTETTDPLIAERFRIVYEHNIIESRVPGSDDAVTFRRAAELYSAFKEPPKSDQDRIDRLVAILGAKPVGEVQQADLVDAAHKLYPGRKNETKNRAVIKPGAAIVHYAAENKWCPWIRIKKFDEGPIQTRASSDIAWKVIDGALATEIDKAETDYQRNLSRKKRLLILWLFRHWNRISDPLRLTWEDIDLTEGTYRMYVAKGAQFRTKPLDDDVLIALANEADKIGRLFPWETRSGVYKWLRPLTRRLGVQFTPHMARHFGGKQLNRSGAGLKTIMGALDHSDAASSLRYQDADVEIVREAMKRAKSAGK